MVEVETRAGEEEASANILDRSHGAAAVAPVAPGGRGRGHNDREEQVEVTGKGQGRGGRGAGGRTSNDPEPNAPADHAPANFETKKRTAEERADDTGKKLKEILRYDICEENHLTSACPIYLGPKPHASFCGFAGEGGFFQVPYDGSAGKTPRKESATALISIREGNILAELMKSEFARLIPVKWTWTAVAHGYGFLVQFPCKVELQRMVATKLIHTVGGEGIMIIEEWNHVIAPSRQLEKVWVNVYGVPNELRHFLPLWTIGTIIGSTLKVDMKYTKKIDVCRILVGVWEAKMMPDLVDIAMGECIYTIFFKVDKIQRDGAWVDYQNDDDFNVDDDDLMDAEPSARGRKRKRKRVMTISSKCQAIRSCSTWRIKYLIKWSIIC